MAKSTTYNMDYKTAETKSQRKRRKEAEANGRGRNSAFTGGARAVRISDDTPEEMRKAWEEARGNAKQTRNANGQFGAKPTGKRQTYTSSARGRMSDNGRTAGGNTWTFSDKENGRQSGRSKMATRRQRYYDVRVGLGLAGG